MANSLENADYLQRLEILRPMLDLFSYDRSLVFDESAGQSSQESTKEPIASSMCRHETKSLNNMLINKDGVMALHNRYFFYGICHECHKFSDKLVSPLKRCSRCHLVYYCSSECQKKDWSSHKDLCKINAVKPGGKNIFGAAKEEVVNGYDWTKYCFRIMNYNKFALKRNLKAFEEHIFCFPRVCFVCKESDPALLIDCKFCISVSYCSEEHKQKDEENHNKFCFFLDMALECYVIVRQFGYLSCSFPLEIPEVFQSLQKKCILHKIPEKDADMIEFDDTLKCLMADAVTYPLSIIYALEKVSVKLGKQEQIISEVHELTVHLVGSWCNKEMLGIKKWEYFMHQLPALKKLRVLFVGPQFWGPGHKNYRHEGKLRGCEHCQKKGCWVLYEESQMLYHEYVQTDYYRHPDVIVAFNCGFHSEAGHINDTWPESLVEMTKYHTVPLIFTSYNIYEAENDLQAVEDASEVEILLDVSKNPFCSLHPIRTLAVTEDCDNIVTFCNAYITVVRGKKQ